jgi:very-short-patch-repair endonuclease
VGLPDPEVNAWLLPDDGPAVRIDFIWRAQRVAVETDGHETHRTRQAFERDRRRDQRLAAAGWRPIRVTWRQIMRTPEQVSATLAALLKR